MTNSNNLKSSKKMNITIRFYEELNDFLQNYPIKKDIEYSFDKSQSVKTIIGRFGVPCVEVDLVLVNGISRGFDYIIKDGDRISVYPMFERYSIKTLTELRSEPLRETKFVLDVHLGKLTRHLRLLGFDAEYDPNMENSNLAEISKDYNRVLLTRNRQLLKLYDVERGLNIHNSDPFLQVVEVLGRLDLWDNVKPFSRCIICNGAIIDVKKEDKEFPHIFAKLPPKVQSWGKEIFICTVCGKTYWKGSHYEKLSLLVEKIMNEKNN
jgi:uncharacterized protein with PIN domain